MHRLMVIILLFSLLGIQICKYSLDSFCPSGLRRSRIISLLTVTSEIDSSTLVEKAIL